ncbi:MAG: MFS transporter [Verrucomicrobia bacterium]|nr:MFS transporter [Verrucomicrobiota bacterium]
MSDTTAAGTQARPASHFRWYICALLFFGTTINYIDRQVIGVLKTTLKTDLGWSETDFGNIVFAFSAAYAIGYAVGGRFMDWVGVRLGYSVAVCLWSLAAMGHAVARTVTGFGIARFFLGLTEGGNFPAAIKTVSEWFPKKERALATGIFNAGSNVGALLTPLMVPWITVHFGWPTAFFVTGSLGLFFVVAWLAVYRHPHEHRSVSPSELAFIRSDPADPPVKIPWLELLRHRQTWAYMVGTFMTSPIWWFYLYWIPGFLNEKHGLKLLDLGPPLVVIYLMTDVGSVGGGWLSSWLIKRGWSINAARKTAFLVCALCVVPIFMASQVTGMWVAVFLIGLAASAHQGFSANLYTLVSDTVPRKAVSSVVGLGGMAGAIGGMFIAKLAGYILDQTGSYFILFAIASTAYLFALLIIHLLVPKMQPMDLSRLEARMNAAPKP